MNFWSNINTILKIPLPLFIYLTASGALERPMILRACYSTYMLALRVCTALPMCIYSKIMYLHIDELHMFSADNLKRHSNASCVWISFISAHALQMQTNSIIGSSFRECCVYHATIYGGIHCTCYSAFR